MKTGLVGKAADIVEVVTRSNSRRCIALPGPRKRPGPLQFLRLHRDFYESCPSSDFSPTHRHHPPFIFIVNIPRAFAVDAAALSEISNRWTKLSVGVLFIYSALYCRVYFDSEREKKSGPSWPGDAHFFTTRSNNRCQNYCGGGDIKRICA